MTSWVCQCGHDSQAHDRLHPEGGPAVYPCTLCPCTNLTDTAAPAPTSGQLHPKGDAARIARLHSLGLVLEAAAKHLHRNPPAPGAHAQVEHALHVVIAALDPYGRHPQDLLIIALATEAGQTAHDRSLVDDAAMERLSRFLFDQDPPAQTPPRHLRAVPPPADGA